MWLVVNRRSATLVASFGQNQNADLPHHCRRREFVDPTRGLK
jgi:hypothetical protein